jgi:tetratricopeptide (TPR) repeat protein
MKTSLYLVALFLVLCSHPFFAQDKQETEQLDSLKKIILLSNTDTSKARAMDQVANIFISINADSALRWSQRCVAFSTKKGLHKFTGLGYMTMATIFRYNLQLPKAKESYLSALNVYSKMNDYNGIAAASGGMMAYHKLANSLTDSVRFYFDKIVVLSDSITDKRVICKAHYNLAVRLLETEDYYAATEHLHQSIKLSEKIHFDDCILYAKTSLAVVKYRMNNIEESIKLNLEVAPKAKGSKLFNLYPAILKNLGVCYEAKGDYDKAEEYCAAALAASANYNIREGVDILYRNMASVKLKKGQIDSAIYYADKCLALVALESRNMHIVNVSLADAYIAKRQYEKAEKLLIEFMKQQQKQKTTKFVSESYHTLAQLYKKWGKYEKACYYYSLNSTLKDSIFGEETLKKVADLQAFYWSQQKKSELALSKKNEELKSKEAEEAKIKNKLYTSQRNGLIVAIILVIVFSILIYKVNLQRKKDKLTRQVSELELKAIRAQMNPHFLFNALSAIQMLINKNDIRQSNLALAKFGRLMRLILEYSEKQTVSIDDEMKMLELYIQLENLRFPFQYSINIDQSIDQENAHIPSMLIQPYVENAIKHGISMKPDNRNLSIQIKQSNDNHLLCTVEDDGIGRIQAEAGKSKYSQHKSMGIKLSQERLELLNKLNSKGAKVIINDLYTETGAPAGTRIELCIPITYNEN